MIDAYLNGSKLGLIPKTKYVHNHTDSISIAETCLPDGLTFYEHNKTISDLPSGFAEKGRGGNATFIVRTIFFKTYYYQFTFTDWGQCFYRSSWSGISGLKNSLWQEFTFK